MSTPEQPPEQQGGERCPNCDAPVQPDQDWCLQCGSALHTRIAQTPNWRAPLAIIGAVLALAAAGIAVAFIELSDDAEQVAATPPPTATPTPSPSAPTTPSTPTTPTTPTIPTVPGTASTPTIPTVPSTGETTPTAPSLPGSTTTTPGTTPGAPESWPPGEAKWTVVVKSTKKRPEADSAAKALTAGGAQAGVLRSDDYSSLRKGYWVVFSGQYDSQKDAEKAAKDLGPKASGAYARFVKPR